MNSRLLELKLLNHSIFKHIKEDLVENSEILRNLIEIQDDILYLWHPAENCLLTLNLKYLEEKDEDIPYQKLNLLAPSSFEVERVLAGAGGTRICLWGARGVVIVELPSRWGRNGLFDGGKQTLFCKSHALDERFLYTQGDVRRVLWHPDSFSHVLVLVSDNTIRLYNIGLKSGPKLVKILFIGPKPSGFLAGKRILESLGDTAVDFTPVPGTDSLLVLRGDGAVYMIRCDITSKSPLPPKLHGPLTMYPPADDNYGEESCCVTAIGGTTGEPPLIVIATSSALIYHCLLLPEAAIGDDQYTPEDKNGPGYSLYVVEAVELNVSLDSDEVQLRHSYPVHLYPCVGNSSTYACLHAAGVHTVSLPLVQQLKEYALADDCDTEAMLSSVHSRASVARYAVCTHDGRGKLCPPVGLAMRAPPLSALLVVCYDGTPVLRTMEPDYLEERLYKEIQLKNPALDQDEINKILKERQKLSFASIVQEILTRDVSQPILKISNKDEPSAKESLEFLTQATLKLRQEYISRQIRAAEAIRKRVTGLKKLNRQQSEWYADVQKEIDDARLNSAVLREKSAIAEKHQEDLKYRCSSVIRGLRASMSTNPAEREILRELYKCKESSEMYSQQIKKLKERANAKSREIEQWREEYKKKDVALGKSHSDTISSILQQQTKMISSLIEETKLLRDQLSIV